MDYQAALKQPWVKYTVGAIVGLGVIWVAFKYASGGSSSGGVIAQQQGVDPAAASLAAHQATLAQQAASQQSAQSYNLAKSAQDAAAALKAKVIDATTSTQQQVNQITGTLSLAELQTMGQIHMADTAAHSAEYAAATNAASLLGLSQIAATTARQQISSTVDIAGLASQTQLMTSQLIAHTQESLANTAAQQHIIDSNLASEAEQRRVAAGLETTRITAGVMSGQSRDQLQLGLAGIAGNVTTAQANIAGNVATAQANAASSTAAAAAAAARDVQLANIGSTTQLGLATIQGNTSTAISHDQSAAAIAWAEMQSAVQEAQIAARRETDLASIRAQREIGEIQSDNEGDSNIIGSIVSGIASIFF